jgi:hypothetical protein
MVLDPTRPEEQEPSTPGHPEQLDASRGSYEPPMFPHQQWMVGVVLIFAVLFIVAGLGDPVWLLIGSPFILTLAVYIWVRLAARG